MLLTQAQTYLFHYWRRMQRTRNPRQRLCRGLPSTKTPRGIFRRRRGLCRGPFIGHSAKPLPKAGAALGKEKQSSRRRRLGRSLCRGPSPGALGKELFFFLKKNLCRGPPTMALGKEMCRIFPKNLCRGQWDDPRQRIILFF